MPKRRIFRVHQRQDGKFESRNEFPNYSPLGVDASLNQALGTAHREATLTSRDEGCAVVIEVMQPNGKWKRHDIIQPPAR